MIQLPEFRVRGFRCEEYFLRFYLQKLNYKMLKHKKMKILTQTDNDK